MKSNSIKSLNLIFKSPLLLFLGHFIDVFSLCFANMGGFPGAPNQDQLKLWYQCLNPQIEALQKLGKSSGLKCEPVDFLSQKDIDFCPKGLLNDFCDQTGKLIETRFNDQCGVQFNQKQSPSELITLFESSKSFDLGLSKKTSILDPRCMPPLSDPQKNQIITEHYILQNRIKKTRMGLISELFNIDQRQNKKFNCAQYHLPSKNDPLGDLEKKWCTKLESCPKSNHGQDQSTKIIKSALIQYKSIYERKKRAQAKSDQQLTKLFDSVLKALETAFPSLKIEPLNSLKNQNDFPSDSQLLASIQNNDKKIKNLILPKYQDTIQLQNCLYKNQGCQSQGKIIQGLFPIKNLTKQSHLSFKATSLLNKYIFQSACQKEVHDALQERDYWAFFGITGLLAANPLGTFELSSLLLEQLAFSANSYFLQAGLVSFFDECISKAGGTSLHWISTNYANTSDADQVSCPDASKLMGSESDFKASKCLISSIEAAASFLAFDAVLSRVKPYMKAGLDFGINKSHDLLLKLLDSGEINPNFTFRVFNFLIQHEQEGELIVHEFAKLINITGGNLTELKNKAKNLVQKALNSNSTEQAPSIGLDQLSTFQWGRPSWFEKNKIKELSPLEEMLWHSVSLNTLKRWEKSAKSDPLILKSCLMPYCEIKAKKAFIAPVAINFFNEYRFQKFIHEMRPEANAEIDLNFFTNQLRPKPSSQQIENLKVLQKHFN